MTEFFCFFAGQEKEKGGKKQKTLKNQLQRKRSITNYFFNWIHIVRSASCYLHIVLKTFLRHKKNIKVSKTKTKKTTMKRMQILVFGQRMKSIIFLLNQVTPSPSKQLWRFLKWIMKPAKFQTGIRSEFKSNFFSKFFFFWVRRGKQYFDLLYISLYHLSHRLWKKNMTANISIS